MPRQDYLCPKHGKFEVILRTRDDVPKTRPCPAAIVHRPPHMHSYTCRRPSRWVPPTVSFPGGPTTGARSPRGGEGESRDD